ncbi:hypothetical protein, partial [Escherichia coli]|uniref:hypothetical protein n=1 Tax=Escherichia coli TaxID=562 RepID=UPI001BC8BFB6
MDRGFGDSQSLKTTPGEHPQQPIEASQLGPVDAPQGIVQHLHPMPHRLGGAALQVLDAAD